MMYSTLVKRQASYSITSQLTQQNPEPFKNDLETYSCDSKSTAKTNIIVIIDSQVEDCEKLLKGVVPGTEVILLNSTEDGVKQITEALRKYTDISEIQIISHGSPGCLQLGNTQLSLDTLDLYANPLQSWSVDSLLLYGCNVAAGDAGIEFIEKLHKITGAKIAASVNKIGHFALGGDWNLEVKTHEFDVSLALSSEAIKNYNFTFPIPINGLNVIRDNPQDNSGDVTYIAPDLLRTAPPGKTIEYNFQVGEDNLLRIDGFTTLEGDEFLAGSILNDFKLRRSNNDQITTPRQLLWFERESQTDDVLNLRAPLPEIPAGSTEELMEIALFDDVINRGTDNIFANTSGAVDQNINNIERVDYIATNGLTASDEVADLNEVGFLILERGGNDAFKIAPILELDSEGVPSQFGELLTITEGDWGRDNNLILNTSVLRSDDYPNNSLQRRNNVDGQPIGGVYISFADLGIVPGQTFNGYALFATDVDESFDLTDFENFPDNTPEQPDGGLDLIAGGVVFSRTLISIGDARVNEGEQATFTVSVQRPVIDPVTVEYTIIEGTATNPEDYTATALTGTVTIPVGETEVTITVDTLPDDLEEDEETFTVSLSNPSRGLIGDAEGIGTIIDVPPIATVSGTVFTDTDGEDDLDPEEPLLAGITVNLVDGNGNVVNTVETGADGVYQFNNVPPGNYIVQVDTNDADLPENAALGTANDVAINVAPNQPLNGVNFGFDIVPPNNPPVANPDTVETPNGNQISFNITTNDNDPDPGDNINPASVDLDPDTDGQQTTRIIPGEGTYTVDNTGELTFTPEGEFSGTSTINYTVNDNNGTPSNPAAITVIVNPPVNQPPDAVDDNRTTPFQTPITINVLGNDSDPEGNPLTIADIQQQTDNGGTVRIVNGQLEYTPAAGFRGNDTFTYTISDGSLTDTATVTVTVEQPANTNPNAVDDERTTPLNTSVPVNVLANDTDAENDPLTIADFDQTSANGGTIARSEDGQLIYTPRQGFVGTDTFTYTINDGRGGTDIATVTINVSDEAPNAVNDTATTAVNTEVSINVLGNDSDPDNDPLEITNFDQTSANGGSIARSDDGQLIYTPPAGFTGNDTFTYTISDGAESDTATVTVTVQPTANTNPDAVDDTRTTRSNTAITINVLTNDTDPENNPLEISGFDTTSASGGTIAASQSGQALVYTPASGFTGTDTFTYTIDDGNGGTDTATVTINVESDQALIAANDFATTDQNTNVTINVLANDVDPENQPLAITSFDENSANGGTITRSGNGEALVYTPAQGFSGTDTFTYAATDGTNTDSATVSVTVNPSTNTEPAAIDDERRTDPNTSVTVNVLTNDTDPDGDPLNIESFDEITANRGTVALSEDNQGLVYTPAQGFVGTDSFTYTINDGQGGTDIAIVTINVIDEQQRPEAVDDSATTERDTNVSINVLTNDVDPDGDPLTIENFDEISANGGTVTASQDGQSLVYTPVAGFIGIDTFTYQVSDGTNTDIATVTVTVEPANPDNQPPTATDENVNTPFATAVTFNLVDNLSDPDGNLDINTIDLDPTTPEINRQVTLPQGTLTVNNQGQVTFTPVGGFSGVVSAPYTVADDLGATSEPANISITVNPDSNQPPTAEDVETSSILNSSAPIPLPLSTGNFSDPDGIVELINFSLPNPGQGTLLLDGVAVTDPIRVQRLTPDQLDNLSFRPNSQFAGNATFTYNVTDSDGANSNVANITIPVIAVSVPTNPVGGGDPSQPSPNLPPQAEDETANIPNDGSRFPLPPLTAVDPDGEVTSYTITQLPPNGTLFLNGEQVTSLDQVQRLTPSQAGQLTFEPDPNFTGDVSFTYTATDNDGAVSNEAIVRLTVADDSSIPREEPIDDGGCGCPPLPEFGAVPLPEPLNLTPNAFNPFGPVIGSGIIAASVGNDTVIVSGGNSTVEAFEGDDRLVGGPGDDRLFGYDGNDSLLGADGMDTLIGSNGTTDLTAAANLENNDFVYGHQSNDLMQGGPGSDMMYGGKQDDFTYTGKGNDMAFGDEGNDTLYGDEGNDTLIGDTADENDVEADRGLSGMIDFMWGGAGDDSMNGGRSNDTLSGGVGNDTVRGGKEDDLVYGEAGSDLIYGDLGSDHLCGNEGNDTIYGDINDNQTISTVPGRDTISGGSGDDVLFGNEDQDRLCGGTENDTLYGGLGEDTLGGERGDDWLFGDQGNDLISGGSGSDHFVVFSGSGTDTILDFQLGTDFIALGGGLTFDVLTVSQSGTSTVISVDGQQLAILNDIQATALTETSFTVFTG
ncbi:Ig-like domain-containing protein [Capilliphycus salinus ALCB114379]|uniref:Ig-like domain-containing protein n=1 Tax=Capilliphycus salinus TaxID=2768948 RepID=UPI0039A7540B